MEDLEKNLWRHQVNTILAIIIAILPFVYLPSFLTGLLVLMLALVIVFLSLTGLHQVTKALKTYKEKDERKISADFSEYESPSKVDWEKTNEIKDGSEFEGQT
jgi:hypothetical protein